MDGEIIEFDDQAQRGTVVSRDGRRYSFTLGDWRGRGLPGQGVVVRFDVRGSSAVQVFNLPEAQRRARPVDTMNRRYANSAIVAIVVAMLGLFLDRLAPLLGMVAIIFAMFGLYRIRHEPERYRGRGFCWAAIVLALLATALSLLVEPPLASSTSQSNNTVMPASQAVG